MGVIISVSIFFDTVETHSCYYNKRDFVDIEYKTPPIYLQSIYEGLEISEFRNFNYSHRGDIGCIIALQDHA